MGDLFFKIDNIYICCYKTKNLFLKQLYFFLLNHLVSEHRIGHRLIQIRVRQDYKGGKALPIEWFNRSCVPKDSNPRPLVKLEQPPASWSTRSVVNNSIFNSSNFSLEIRATYKSSLFWASSYACNSCLISNQLGLHVIVKNMYGFPNHCTNIIASIYLLGISLGPPIKDSGKIIFLPILEAHCSLILHYQ